jgi:aminopeptidase
MRQAPPKPPVHAEVSCHNAGMSDTRHHDLAGLLARHSTRVKTGEHVLVEAWDTPEPMLEALIDAIRAEGGHAHLALRSSRLMPALVGGADTAALECWAACDRQRMERMDCYVGIRGSGNISELAGLSAAEQKAWGRDYLTPVHFEQRVAHTRWVVLRWPSAGMAQLAGMSTREFEAFYFAVCTLDYARMAEAVKPLAARMESADAVHIVGPGDTDLSFSIKGIPVRSCTGEHNIPDGECFTAPVRESVEGVLHCNAPTVYNGKAFDDVRLVFKGGRVVEATAAGAGTDALVEILDTDAGARFVGEFAIGFNPRIVRPMRDILFDEKIAGSFHFTPGRAYDDADNGNRSEIHWDLVTIQRSETGGGEIRFDGETIRRDGLFLPEDLAGLNPDRLGG